MSVGRALRFRVFARDGFVCQYCGQQPPDVVLEPDHIHPTSRGGKDEFDNLLTSCFDCNRGKRGRLIPAALVIAQAARASTEKAEQEAAMIKAKAIRTMAERTETPHPLTYLRWKSIEKRIPVPRSRVTKWIREGKFPKPVLLGARTEVWRGIDIDEWILQSGWRKSQ